MKYIRQKLGPKKKKRQYIIEEMFKEAKKEIDKHPLELCEKFTELFPCSSPKFRIPHKTKQRLSNTSLIVKPRSVGMTTYSNYWYPFEEITVYVRCSSVEDFWGRWNRFKKLIAFL
jgi:hypothetical protein